ncbi:GNAT family N-acetyltransferase [Hyphomonas pacifica]|uniref:Uncharacterized protein n=1 Tax=Hyphomonas pacifica TaxID=1280941 RepID=A0A062U1M8_9PROT|nr:GNAT family N-acetyltransferase [Hyphomonas pacifica]KCZ51643.1 hypothetical protein HY2_01425 [Hyphomonas pacifica]RAN32464.1 hypothetical protein HY11_05190 [Hyphomonas pacifica]RAN34312.1 hypothetical protein HY3_01510 [Hyphomonas pacifica]
MPAKISIGASSLSAAEFVRLRAGLGWGEVSEEDADRSLRASLFQCTARAGGEAIGFGRVVGDGVMYFYIQDMMIRPEHQGHGIGASILETLLGQIREKAGSGAMIGLMAAKGKAGFYEKYGFVSRPNEAYDPGMILVL